MGYVKLEEVCTVLYCTVLTCVGAVKDEGNRRKGERERERERDVCMYICTLMVGYVAP